MATTARPPATEADLLAQPKDGRKYELVDGAIRVSPAGSRHEVISSKLIARLLGHVEQGRLGWVLGSSAGYRLPGGNVRSPDVSFVARGRFDGDVPPEGFSPVPPDLAIEVLSPEDRPREVFDKVGECLGAGVRLVWIIDPRKRKATVYRSVAEARTLTEADALDGEEVVPGFVCPISDIL
jgi:Uma2 family endonuclease